MPIYDYQCTKCQHRFERIQKFSDPIVDTCPQCGGAVERLLSAPAVQFKGSGWYVTDYARKGGGGSKGEAKTDGGKSESSSAGEGSSSSSSDKPAAKSDDKK